MTEPMKTYDELYNDMLKSINVEETDQSAFDKEVAIVYAAQQVIAEREKVKYIIKQMISDASSWTNEELYEIIDSL